MTRQFALIWAVQTRPGVEMRLGFGLDVSQSQVGLQDHDSCYSSVMQSYAVVIYGKGQLGPGNLPERLQLSSIYRVRSSYK